MTDEIPAWVNGKLKPVDKLEVHIRGLRHLAVSVFIFDGAHTLLQRRAMEKYHTPGLWANACCTHPQFGEDPAKCARRRLQEELGIDAPALTPRQTVEYRAAVGSGLIEHEVVSLFLLNGRPEPHPNPAEVMDTRWISLRRLSEEIADAPERFTPWLRIYMREHAEQIFGTLTA